MATPEEQTSSPNQLVTIDVDAIRRGCATLVLGGEFGEGKSITIVSEPLVEIEQQV